MRLLERWQDVSNRHPPTKNELVFDELVFQHPGLFLSEPVWNGDDLVDLRYEKVGPEHDARNGRTVQGLFYSEALHARIWPRSVRAYSEVLKTGEPHYWEIINTAYGAPPQRYVRLLLPLYDAHGRAASFLGSRVWIDAVTS
ncbi:MAG: hypothetical protein ACR2PS_03335 [Pseudomonadales bacterium]